jgi:hypothetical protein
MIEKECVVTDFYREPCRCDSPTLAISATRMNARVPSLAFSPIRRRVLTHKLRRVRGAAKAC